MDSKIKALVARLQVNSRPTPATIFSLPQSQMMGHEHFTFVLRRMSERLSYSSPTTTEKWGLRDFSPELLARIFLNLSYKSLLSVMAVSVQWNAIVEGDPALAVQMFKRCSMVYVEPGSPEQPESHIYYDDPTNRKTTELVRLHPAVQIPPSYVFGDGLQTAVFSSDTDEEPKLINLAIANDFISIPAVTTLKINHDIERDGAGGPLTFTIKNSEGVKVLDLFSQIETLSRPIKTRYGTRTRAEIDLLECADYVNYDGLHELFRKGLTLWATMAPSG
ncbi:hypothetical protein FB451DRAFT_460574 [Mycena latifolia]|nr:hypothetical protein FB451DRAFT_460574 [Mycena latifolia]